MTHVLEVIYSLPFILGGVAGLIGYRVYLYLRARWLNAHRPLPNGDKHHSAHISRVWLAGALAFATLGYVVLQVGQTENSYRELAAEMAYCQEEFYVALKARAAITTENDRLTRHQGNLFLQRQEAEAAWLNRIVNPPPDIAALDEGHPRRQAWNIDVSRVYFENANAINAKIRAISDQQSDLEEKRRLTPLPEPTCGIPERNPDG